MSKVDGVDAFLRSGQGHAATWRALERQGLPQSLAADLVQEVLARTLYAEANGGTIENAEAWATVLLHRVAVDLLRGELRAYGRTRPMITDDDGGDDPVDGDIALDALDTLVVVGLRGALQAVAGRRPLAVACALARLAIVHGRAVPAADCPRPEGGAGVDAADDWAAIWYGGDHRAFVRPDAPAVRQHRRRSIDRMREVLIAAALRAGVVEGASDG